MFQGHNNGLTGICPAQIQRYTVSRQPMTSDLDVSYRSAAVLLAASFRFPTLLPLAAVLLAARSFLTLDIAHGEERGHVQTAGAVVLVLFLHMRVLSVLSAGAGPAPAKVSVMYRFLHPDCLKFSALASCPQFTYAAFHRIACDGCYHARAVPGGEYLLSAVIASRELPGFSEAGVGRSFV